METEGQVPTKAGWRNEDKSWIVGISLGCFFLSLCSAVLIFLVKPKVPALINPTQFKSAEQAGRAAFHRLRPLLNQNSRLTIVAHEGEKSVLSIVDSLISNVKEDPKLSQVPVSMEANPSPTQDAKGFRLIFQRVRIPFVAGINCKESLEEDDKVQCFIEQIMNSYAPKKWQKADGVFSLHQISKRDFLFLLVQK